MKRPENIEDIKEWLKRQNVNDTYLIDVVNGIKTFGFGSIAEETTSFSKQIITVVHLLKDGVSILEIPLYHDNEEDKVRAVSTLIETLIEQGVTPDWK